jgi:cytoskeletal protein RodZ
VVIAMTAERPAGDIGKKLREARERKGVSLRQIANSTKIAVAVLDGLERNDISKLPGGIFGRAFVRSFAAEVGLDPEATIQEFHAQFRDEFVAAGYPPSERIEDNGALESRRRMARTVLGLIALGIPVAAVSTYFGWIGRRQPPVAAVPETAMAITAAATTAPSPQSVGDVGSPAPARANQQPASDAALGDRMVITLAVTRDCWMSATVDGQKKFERLLKPGDERTLEVQYELALSVGDAAAVTMTVNGVAARPLGKSGQVVTVRLNPTNINTYLPPR